MATRSNSTPRAPHDQRHSLVGEEAAVLARDCISMDQVRSEIDRLDRALVRLMAERQAYIEAAGRIKERADEVRLEWRIEDVVRKVLEAAEREGLSKRIAEPVWRELIDRCIEHEHHVWAAEHPIADPKITKISDI